MAAKRKDKNRVVLRTGESYRQTDKRYSYRWTDRYGRRHSVYAKTLTELRAKEKDISKDISDGIRTESFSITLNDLYHIWKDVKRGIKDVTFQHYCYMYEKFVESSIGKLRLAIIKKTDIKRFYISLAEVQKVSLSTVSNVHTVIHQIFSMAVEDNYIRFNPSEQALRELKKEQRFSSEKRTALTAEQQKIFLDYLITHKKHTFRYPIFAVMLGTGLRVGEATGLRWEDVDLDKGVIDVNHSLSYYRRRTAEQGGKAGYCFTVNSPKTQASKRKIPILDFVKEAFLMERHYQEEADIHCESEIDGYSDFVFLNSRGKVYNQMSLDKAIDYIIRECNSELVAQGKTDLLLPHFSCHSLRHTFATRMCEYGVNVKVVQDVMGHTDISTTMNIYTDATKDMKNSAFRLLNAKFADTDEAVSDTNPNIFGNMIQY